MLELPLVSMESTSTAMDESAQTLYVRSASATGKKHKVLLVEDDSSNALVATTFLENLGYEYDVACDGQDVINKAKITNYSFILMDVNIPGIDGITATRELRSMQQAGLIATTPIIAMTAHAMMEDRQKCLNAGMNDYISKPFSQEHLQEKLTQNLAIAG